MRENYNEYMNNYMKRRWEKRRIEALNHLGNKCIICNSKVNLEFDHINPKDKSFTIARASSFSNKKFWEEVDKCQLLCTDCHREKHEAKHGSLAMYSHHKCRCKDCISIWNEYHRK